MLNRKTLFFYSIVSSLLLLSIILILFHGSIFHIEKQIIPNQHYTMQVSGDEKSGGNSTASWVNKDEGIWQCTIAYKLAYPFCFIQIFLGNSLDQGVNFEKYEQAHIQIDYQGNADNLIVFFNNYNPAYSSVNNYHLNKYNHVKISPTEFLNNTVIVNLDEFTVAQWWLDEVDNSILPRKLRYTELNNIVNMGLQIESNHGSIEHVIAIKTLTLMGFSLSKEQLYLYIILFWAAAILLLISIKFYGMYLEISHKNQNLEELNKNKQKLERLSKTDLLTGLNNRVGVEHYYQSLLNNGGIENIVVGLIDVDYFKKINDTFGHDVGDMVLKELAVLINSSCRIKDCIGRWGGEEFIVLWPEIDIETATNRANDLREKIAKYQFNIPDNHQVTISIGISLIDQHLGFEQGVKASDINLYKAKKEGRNQVVSS